MSWMYRNSQYKAREEEMEIVKCTLLLLELQEPQSLGNQVCSTSGPATETKISEEFMKKEGQSSWIFDGIWILAIVMPLTDNLLEEIFHFNGFAGCEPKTGHEPVCVPPVRTEDCAAQLCISAGCHSFKRWTFSSLTKFRFWRPGAKQVRVVSKSVVLHILKNNNDILKEYAISTNGGYKCQNHGKEADFGEAPGLWFQHKLGHGTHLSRLILKQTRTQLAAEQENESNNSNGWLSHWFNVRNTVRNKMLIFWQLLKWNVDTLLSFLDEFHPHDIFSADETSLCYRGF
ncbi:hypothetical protein KIL84_019907 [Mauremys mutica]|uniref:Transposase n=1 Tax=Mauremys mutica TaxID=74926 RepID=A0A9D3XVV1_9SAUR|nr:hypothetical protein KIL84_019907 [Mauremys mutica]